MKQALHERLSQYDQQHLLDHWDALTEAERTQLAEQCRGIDFDQLAWLFRHQSAAENWEQLARRAEAPPSFRLHDNIPPISAAAARKRGEEVLAAGQVGVILVAGGQGTRLSFDHPKGMYPIGAVSGATLFQILLEKLLASARRHGVSIPLYVMTSHATHAETAEYFQQNQRFGLPADDVRLFRQGTMPAVDRGTGRVLLAERCQLALSPDGHGGMLAALVASGALDEIRSRGIEHLFYLQVDNPLVKVCDREFLGYHVLSNSELSTQVVAKRTLRDKLGNVVSIDGKLRILEYSDLNPLSDEILDRKMPDGQPVFWAGNTGVHVFERALLERAAGDAETLPFHIAKKVVPHVNSAGKAVEPREANAIKFERFIFDLLPAARRGIVVEVSEAEVFAPIKNAPGDERDSPDTVARQMIALHTEWLSAAGAKVKGSVPVEISPLFALDAEEVRRRVKSGTKITEPTYFGPPKAAG